MATAPSTSPLDHFFHIACSSTSSGLGPSGCLVIIHRLLEADGPSLTEFAIV
jgi:hypothetical protein